MTGRLRLAWLAGDANAVRSLDQRVEGRSRPSWALGIALACVHACARPDCAETLLDELVDIGMTDYRWPEARAAFQRLRTLTLALEKSGEDPLCADLVYVAECAAKVIYNASGSPAPAPFDANSGEKMIAWAHKVATGLPPGGQETIWRAVAMGKADL